MQRQSKLCHKHLAFFPGHQPFHSECETLISQNVEPVFTILITFIFKGRVPQGIFFNNGVLINYLKKKIKRMPICSAYAYQSKVPDL